MCLLPLFVLQDLSVCDIYCICLHVTKGVFGIDLFDRLPYRPILFTNEYYYTQQKKQHRTKIICKNNIFKMLPRNYDYVFIHAFRFTCLTYHITLSVSNQWTKPNHKQKVFDLDTILKTCGKVVCCSGPGGHWNLLPVVGNFWFHSCRAAWGHVSTTLEKGVPVFFSVVAFGS